MATATKTKQSVASKSMEKMFRAMTPGSEIRFSRGDATITFHRDDFGICHSYPGGMHYEASFRLAADWFSGDDGKGEWCQI